MLSFALDLVGDLVSWIIDGVNAIGTRLGIGSSELSSDGLSSELSGGGLSS